jgi:hypothetical protein
MRFIVLSFCFFIALSVLAQSEKSTVKHYDTLFYKSGMIRPCTITSTSYPMLDFNATNSKGIEVKSSISVHKLKYFVEYDSTGTVRLNGAVGSVDGNSNQVIKPKEDSLSVYNQQLSLNPFSPFFVGLNLDYMYRFGQDLRFAVHVPFRIFTWFGSGILLNTGLGLNYIPFENENALMYVGVIPEFYFVEGNTIFGIPVILGYSKHLTKQLTFNGYVGAGPKFSQTFDFPLIIDAHVGIGFNLGTKQLIKTQ